MLFEPGIEIGDAIADCAVDAEIGRAAVAEVAGLAEIGDGQTDVGRRVTLSDGRAREIGTRERTT
jgi:hypothetical protein